MLQVPQRIFAIAVILFAFTGAAHSAQRAERIAHQIDSPDTQLRAVIIALAPTTAYGGEESRVEIRDHRGTALAAKDFSSSDSNQGEVVDDADWTPDSQFFVFSVSSSGGHEPWQSSVWFYSESQRRFREISELINDRPVLSDRRPVFQIVPSHSVKIATWKNLPQRGKGEPDHVVLTLDLAVTSRAATPKH